MLPETSLINLKTHKYTNRIRGRLEEEAHKTWERVGMYQEGSWWKARVKDKKERELKRQQFTSEHTTLIQEKYRILARACMPSLPPQMTMNPTWPLPHYPKLLCLVFLSTCLYLLCPQNLLSPSTFCSIACFTVDLSYMFQVSSFVDSESKLSIQCHIGILLSWLISPCYTLHS